MSIFNIFFKKKRPYKNKNPRPDSFSKKKSYMNWIYFLFFVSQNAEQLCLKISCTTRI